MTPELKATREAIRGLRVHVWDLDYCYALDRLMDAAQSVGQALAHVEHDPARAAKLDKQLRKMALDIMTRCPRELTPRDVEIMDMDARNKAQREDA